VAATFASVLGCDVRAEVVAQENWERLFRAQGMKHPTPRIQMLEGLNRGWIKFEGDVAEPRKGKIRLEQVLRSLVERQK